MRMIFNRTDGKWFLDWPAYLEAGGTKDDLEMVFGADTFLSDRCVIGKDTVTIDIQFERMKGYSELVRSSNNLDAGAFYVHVEQIPYSVDCNIEPDYIPTVREVMWLCDVVKWIFGDFPKNIYFKVL